LSDTESAAANPITGVTILARRLVFGARPRYTTGMRWVLDKLAGFLSFLCRVFDVPPENMDDGQRGNMPPPSGGISSLGPR
jgi:hypothetical protein